MHAQTTVQARLDEAVGELKQRLLSRGSLVSRQIAPALQAAHDFST